MKNKYYINTLLNLSIFAASLSIASVREEIPAFNSVWKTSTIYCGETPIELDYNNLEFLCSGSSCVFTLVNKFSTDRSESLEFNFLVTLQPETSTVIMNMSSLNFSAIPGLTLEQFFNIFPNAKIYRNYAFQYSLEFGKLKLMGHVDATGICINQPLAFVLTPQ